VLQIGLRQRIIEETDGPKKDEESDADQEMDEDEKIRHDASKRTGPSSDALANFEDYCGRLESPLVEHLSHLYE